MKQLKLFIIIILIWFVGFYNLERLVAPINLASFVYVLATAYALFIILYTPVYRFSIWWLFLASLVPYIGLKLVFQSPIAGMNLPLTVTEVVGIAVTIYLSRQIGHNLEALRTEIMRLTVGPTSVAAHPFRSAQAEFYREIRRARHYNRPAAVLSIAPSKESVDLAISRFLLDAQNSIIRQYIVARTADLLRSDLKETDIVTMHENHFLVLLPETDKKHLEVIIDRLQSSANQQFGLTLNVGSSTFPEEAVTFESLVEHAEKRMKDPTAINLGAKKQPVQPTEDQAADHQPNKELNNADMVR